ncbi:MULTISPECIES: hypothetical protein [unclassified Sphingomonas]|uniref:hypothetical protein n=1 Tax=unclassified Sphingomonas TaxID=196159 RepID=UPI001F3895E9|nr:MULTISPECIES: hypothetical protein [unclassified Sphingomonas]
MPEPVVATQPDEAKPVRRRTPRVRAEAAPLEAVPAEAAPSIDADRLPPALSTPDDGAERPRRRRITRVKEEVVPPAA